MVTWNRSTRAMMLQGTLSLSGLRPKEIRGKSIRLGQRRFYLEPLGGLRKFLHFLKILPKSILEAHPFVPDQAEETELPRAFVNRNGLFRK